jgi:hypothetical protein
VKFRGELKLPEIDHPGVPVTVLIEGSQTELVVENESLGRWSLYDVHARRLVASAFEIDLDGTEVTFVADDPVDFAYRGVEHMAETWATLKSKRIGSRGIAVRRSRKGTIPGRIDDLKAAMVSNLEAHTAPRHLAGEVSMPDTVEERPAGIPSERTANDWDKRDGPASIPVVGSEGAAEPLGETPSTESPAAGRQLSEEVAGIQRQLEEERFRLAEERAKLEEERRIAEQQEADRIEAYRLEMKRLEAEREALRRQAESAWQGPLETSAPVAEPEPDVLPVAEPEPEVEPQTQVIPEAEPELETEEEPEPQPEAEPEAETPRPGLVDLSDLEEKAAQRGAAPTAPVEEPPPPPPSRPAAPVSAPSRPQPEPEPAMAGAAKEKSGFMGAVRAAFRTSEKDHEHQFIEAPGGIGITRYVCEECGYVSISA